MSKFTDFIAKKVEQTASLFRRREEAENKVEKAETRELRPTKSRANAERFARRNVATSQERLAEYREAIGDVKTAPGTTTEQKMRARQDVVAAYREAVGDAERAKVEQNLQELVKKVSPNLGKI